MIGVCASLLLIVLSVCLLLPSVAFPAAIFYTGLAVCLFALPGIFIGMALFGRRFFENPESLIFGAAIGIGLSDYAALAIGYLVKWSVPWVFATVACVALVSAAASRTRWDRPLVTGLRPWVPADYAILLGMCATLVAFVTIPFRNLGKLTTDGYAYAWLFGFDFLLRAAQTAMVTLHLPPDYLHLTGHVFHYYLVSFALPAFAYSASGKALSVHPILLLTTLSLGFLFLGCLYAFLRHFVVNRRALAWTAIVAMAGYSYYAWYILAKHLLPDLVGRWAPEGEVPGLLGFGNVSHLFQRLFLDEPQALTGLCIFLLVLFLLERTHYEIKSYGLAVVLGLGLGIEFGIEGWYGLVLGFWFALVVAIRWFMKRDQIRAEYGPLTVAIGLCGLIYLSFFALGVYDFASGRMVRVEPNWWAFRFLPIYLPLEYGPILLLGLWGLRCLWRQYGLRESLPLVLLFVVILLHVFFVTGSTSRNLGLMRGNRLLPVVLLVWTGLLFESLFHRGAPPWPRRVAILFVLAAVPTYFTDVHYASDIYDRGTTAYVRVADWNACAWIRRNLPESAVVQGEPEYRGLDIPQGRAVSLIADFAERHMVLGQYWIATTILPGSEPIARQRMNDLHRMFTAKQLPQIIETVRKYKINYLYVGPYEQQLYPKFLGLVQSAPVSFREVYSVDRVHIFDADPVLASASEDVRFSGDARIGDLR